MVRLAQPPAEAVSISFLLLLINTSYALSMQEAVRQSVFYSSLLIPAMLSLSMQEAVRQSVLEALPQIVEDVLLRQRKKLAHKVGGTVAGLLA